MLTLVLLALGIACAWLALDAWRLRGGSRLPYLELLRLRGQSADHLTLEEQKKRQEFDERIVSGKTSLMFVVFVIVSIGCFLGATLQLVSER